MIDDEIPKQKHR